MNINNTGEDIDRVELEVAITRFAEAMRAKLMQKYDEGYREWDSMSLDDLYCAIEQQWERLGENTKDDGVDLANYCMFFWYNRNKNLFQ